MVQRPLMRRGVGVAGSTEQVESQTQTPQILAMPSTTAHLIGRPRGYKMVDYVIFVEPCESDVLRVDKIRGSLFGERANHTDYHPLRRRPVVLSAESKKPGEGYRDAQIQIGVWQAAQWALLESLMPR